MIQFRNQIIMMNIANNVLSKFDRGTKISQSTIRLSKEPQSRIFDIAAIYKKLNPYITYDPKVNIHIIQCLKTADELWSKYCDSTNKNSKSSSIILKRFKIVSHRLIEQIDSLFTTLSLDPLNQVKKQIKTATKQIQKGCKRYWEYEKELREGVKVFQQSNKQRQLHEEEVKEQMLEIVDRFKKYAKDISGTIKSDGTVIQQINSKQQRQLKSIAKKTNDIKEITSQQKLGFFQLLIMGVIAIALWIICMFFIIII